MADGGPFPLAMDRYALKEIVLDQRAVFERRPVGTPRTVLAEVERHLAKPHAITVTGVRRCGKSTLMRQMAERFFADGYYYCQFEDERLLGFGARDFALLHEVLI